MPTSRLVPPLPFFPASTVCSAVHFAGFLRPASDHGVRHVSRSLKRISRQRSQGAPARPAASVLRRGPQLPSPSFRFPSNLRRGQQARGLRHQAHASWGSIPSGATPFEAFPSPTAVPRHRGRCPLAVEPWIRVSLWTCPVKDLTVRICVSEPSTSRLCSAVESVAPLRRFRRTSARCSHGLVHLFQGQ